MTEAAAAAWAQVLSLGVVWVGVHCAGMCGPLLIGLDVAGVSRGTTAVGGAAGVLLYQAGRALTYVALGALAGAAGAGLREVFARAGSVVALLLGGVLLAWLVLRLARPPGARRTLRIERPGEPPPPDPWVARASRALLPVLGDGRRLNLVALGAMLGLLPCMIPAWVLGLAATTGSPLHGAALMATLVALTTPALLGVTLLPRLVTRRLGAAGRHLPSALMGISALWLVMVGLAGLDLIDHLHLRLGGGYSVMLW